jgi:hypothetical protein
VPRNALYALLYQRGVAAGGATAPFGADTRRALWAALALGSLPALALTLLETAFHSGATVHLVARRA